MKEKIKNYKYNKNRTELMDELIKDYQPILKKLSRYNNGSSRDYRKGKYNRNIILSN